MSVPFPTTPSHPKLHKSISNPLLSSTSNETTPNQRSSLSATNVTSPTLPPGSPNPNIPKNYHPYLIHTTSSSLLTQSNSSPAQPISSLGAHRVSRSMSSLSHAALSPVKGGSVHGDDDEEGRRRSVDSPGRPILKMKRSGTLPSFPTLGNDTPTKAIEESLPANPKYWTPSELARYLTHTLRTGGPDGNGQILPAPLVRDIESWVWKNQISGKIFLKNSGEGWIDSSRPPPFLPLLQSIARRLRRSSLQNRVSGGRQSFENPLSPSSSHRVTSSVLLEEDDGDISPIEPHLTGVRRMAQKIETHSGQSDFEDHTTPLKAQYTGESDRSDRTDRSVRKRWEERISLSMIPIFSQQRRGSNLSTGQMGDIESSPSFGRRVLSNGSTSSDDSTFSKGSGESAPSDEVPQTPLDVSPILPSPEDLKDDVGEKGFKNHLLEEEEHSILTPPARESRERFSVTPTPERSKSPAPLQLDDSNKSEREMQMDRYSALVHGRPSASSGSEDDSAENRLPGSKRHGTRRVTVRANQMGGSRKVDDIFAQETSQREKEMAEQMEKLMARCAELEKRLESVEEVRPSKSNSTPEVSRPVTPSKLSRPSSPILSMIPESMLVRFGLLPQDDGLPTRVSELPVYLFLVGVGVGAVMVRVLIGRK